MHDLTTGSIPRHLLKTTGFMLGTMPFRPCISWSISIGSDAWARKQSHGAAIASNLPFVVLAITQMLGVGVITPVSHAAGQKDPDRASLFFNQSLILSVLVGIVLCVVAMPLRMPYAKVRPADATTAALAADYLLWFIPAMALQFGIVSMAAALRGKGNFKPGMVVQTATVILNITLAPFLIFGWVPAGARRCWRGNFVIRGRSRRIGVAVVVLRGARART